MKSVLLRKENMSSFQQLLVQLVSLLDSLRNCWVVMLLEVLEVKRRYLDYGIHTFCYLALLYLMAVI
jgi:hypothetical protein